jgi:hypothetical protein
MAVDPPTLEHPLGIAIFARPSNVIHDLVTSVFNKCGSDARSDFIQRLLPRDSFPLAPTTLTDPFQGKQDAFGIVYLI